MIARDFQPSNHLKDYIHRYRLRHFLFNGSIIPSYKPFPPRPEQSLTFYPRGIETKVYDKGGSKIQKPRSLITGQFTNRIDRYVSSPEFLMIEVNLKPGALHRLTGVSFTEFTNQDIDAETFFSSGIVRVNERLSSTDTYPEMIAIIELFFSELVKKTKIELLNIDHLLNLVTKDASDFSVDLLAKSAYLSPRQLARKFDERVGVSPKIFLRIARFNQSYWMRFKNPSLDWFSIAIACGYSDYQHLVKDYKEFTNTTPNIFFREESKAPGRVLGLTK